MTFDAFWPDVGDRLDPGLLDVVRAERVAADVEGRMSERSLEAMRESGYLGAPIPRELRGGGLGMLESCAVQRAVAKADPALAVALNMHLFSVGMVVEHWRRHKDEAWLLLEAIADQRRVVASAFAEPGLAGSILRSTLRAEAVDGGYQVTGTKRPCSLAACCDLICLQFVAPGDGGEKDELCVALLPSHAPGVAAVRSWDAMGMRGSASDTLSFTEVVIPRELVYHRSPVGQDDDPVFAAGLAWFCLTTATTYLAIVERAVEESVVALRSGRVAGTSASRSQSELVQARLGSVVGEILTLSTAVTGQCRVFDVGVVGLPELMAAIAVKAAAVRHASLATGALTDLVGGTAYARGCELERLWRDAQAGRFHPPTGLVSDRVVGAATLGEPTTFDLTVPEDAR